MELLQLRYFYESAKNQNFSKTAQMFMVPTTSVSASIKRLELELGCQLFDRSANRIRLNDNGLLLQQSLCSVFQELDKTFSKLSGNTQDNRQIKILVRSMRRKVTDIIIQYSKLHPDFAFQVIFDQGDIDLSGYDIIIDDQKARYDNYDRIELFQLRLRLKCSVDHPLLNQKLTLSQLSDQPFLSLNSDSNTYKILVSACNQAGFTPQTLVICNDIDCYEKFIAAGIGIGILRQESGSERSAHHLRDLDVVDFSPSYTVYAYYSQEEYYGNVENFIHFLKARSIAEEIRR